MKNIVLFFLLLVSPLALAGTPFAQMTIPKPIGTVYLDKTPLPAFAAYAYGPGAAFQGEADVQLQNRNFAFHIPAEMQKNYAVYVTAFGPYLLPKGMRYLFYQGASGGESLHMRNQSGSVEVRGSVVPGASWNNNKTTYENKILLKNMPESEKSIIRSFAKSDAVRRNVMSMD
ncbi:hypothetical protein [Acidithiobacillus acidisediminis]|uniref:hypothetical protein n=1 Tax=Acidithiobacillus acidisediminis TaxID=2937799 RepID=UPI00200DE019|nr:hypothetical protein [Acidithiobacillus sp. S30A2]